MIAERKKIPRDGERGRAGADEGDALAVLLCRGHGKAAANIVLVVGRHALQAADRDRLRRFAAFLDAHAPAGRFARAVAGASQDAGKHVGLPINHIGVAVPPSRDEADIFGHRRMGRTRPLAIDDLMEIVWVFDIGRAHSRLLA